MLGLACPLRCEPLPLLHQQVQRNVGTFQQHQLQAAGHTEASVSTGSVQHRRHTTLAAPATCWARRHRRLQLAMQIVCCQHSTARRVSSSQVCPAKHATFAQASHTHTHLVGVVLVIKVLFWLQPKHHATQVNHWHAMQSSDFRCGAVQLQRHTAQGSTAWHSTVHSTAFNQTLCCAAD